MIYKSTAVYDLTMRLLYGRHARTRQVCLADLIPDGASVLDVCCGTCRLGDHLLERQAGSQYRGLDLSPSFVRAGKARGFDIHEFDLLTDPLPSGFDYVVLQASLYQFVPHEREILERLASAAGEKLIVAEPIRNLATSNNRFVRFLSSRLADPGTGEMKHRFTEETLTELIDDFGDRILDVGFIPGGREQFFVLQGAAEASQPD